MGFINQLIIGGHHPEQDMDKLENTKIEEQGISGKPRMQLLSWPINDLLG